MAPVTIVTSKNVDKKHLVTYIACAGIQQIWLTQTKRNSEKKSA
jgi:hypothetical protein